MGTDFQTSGSVSAWPIFPLGFGLTGVLRSTITLPNFGHPLPSRQVVLQVAGEPLAARTIE